MFVSDGRKSWQPLLCTDLEMEASQILDYYARRWSIEVFFKDAKQMLYMAKEQSNTFDALVACHSLVMARYLLLVYILSKRRMNGPVGPLVPTIVGQSKPAGDGPIAMGICQRADYQIK